MTRAPSLATQLLMCVLILKTSHRPDGIFTCFARVLAGWRCAHRRWHGDLLIVHHHWQHSFFCACMFESSHRPDGKIADALASTLACTTAADALVNYTVGTCRRDLEFSHRPDGIFTCFALVFAGRRCLCPGWLGDLLIVHHHGQHGSICACSCSRSKVPIAPVGIPADLPNRLSSFNSDRYLVLSGKCTC